MKLSDINTMLALAAEREALGHLLDTLENKQSLEVRSMMLADALGDDAGFVKLNLSGRPAGQAVENLLRERISEVEDDLVGLSVEIDQPLPNVVSTLLAERQKLIAVILEADDSFDPDDLAAAPLSQLRQLGELAQDYLDEQAEVTRGAAE